MPRPRVLRALNEQTGPQHQALERKMAPLLGPMSMSGYLTLLARLWGFYSPLEEQLAGVSGWSALDIDLPRRMKAPLLMADIRSLEHAPVAAADLAVCTALPNVATLDRALGCLYVLEGATLGGQVIARSLQRSLSLDASRGCAFFSSYGAAVGTMWNACSEALQAHCGSDDVASDFAIRGACDTFAALDGWLFDQPRGSWLM